MGKARVYCLSHHIEILFFKSLEVNVSNLTAAVSFGGGGAECGQSLSYHGLGHVCW